MLTPQEIKEKTFEKAVFGGYDMAAVDDFMLPLSEDYASLYKENSILKGKLKVLVETVEEYRSVDAAMRKALLSAQKMAEETVEEAKKESRLVLEEAREQARGQIEDLRAEILDEEKRLELAREQTAKFIAEAMAIHKTQIDMLTKLPDIVIPRAAQKPTHAQNIKTTAEEIDYNVNSRFPDELNSASYMTAETSNDEQEEVSESDGDTKIIGRDLYGEGSAPEMKTETLGPGADFDINNPGELSESDSGLKMKVFEFKIGDKNKLDDEVTAELPALDDSAFDESDEDIPPPPRFNFDNLQFGKDYSMK